MSKKRLLIVTTTLILFTTMSMVVPVFGQNGVWEKLDMDFSGNLADIYFINPDTGWLALSDGSILKSYDGGLNWELVKEPDSTATEAAINRILFIDHLNGWAAGDLGLIIHTLDGGNTWIEQRKGGSKITGLCFVNENIGWAVSETGDILKTNDGGQTWISQVNPDTNSAELLDVKFTSPYNGWICGEEGLLMHTVNGGENWELVPSTTEYSLMSLSLADSLHGWAVGSWGTVIHTTDGVNWQFQPCGTDKHLRAVSFVDTSYGWAVGKSGTAIFTTDGGQTWSFTPSKLSGMLQRVQFVDPENGWIIDGSLYKYVIQTGVETEVMPAVVTSLALLQNYPNPVSFSVNSAKTTINFQLTEPTSISIEIFNVLGQKVKTLIFNQEYFRGVHSVSWNGLNDHSEPVPAGTYFYRIQTPNAVLTKKLLIVE